MDPEEGNRLLIDEYSRMAAVYDRDYAPYHAPMVARLLDLTQPSDGERLLDLGCGTGILASAAAQRIRAPGLVVGIDAAAGMVEFAVAKSDRAGLGVVRFAHMDNRKLAFRGGAFDIVLSCFGIGSLGHERALQEAYRILRTDGRLGICHWAAGGGQAPSVVGLLRRFRPKELSDEVRRLIEARQSIEATGEPTAFGDPDGLVKRLKAIGFSGTTRLSKEERVEYPDAAAYLARGLAMGDNEREFRQLSPVNRAAFLRAFEEETARFMTDEGFVAHVGVNYLVARK